MRGFISVTAHPDGCAANVRAQVEVAKASVGAGGLGDNVLVIGSSTGYGLASTLSACFGYGAATLGVCFERPSSEDKLGTAGWYNLAEAHRLAAAEGRHLETINGDAFSHEVKQQVIDALRARFGKLDVVVYSLASPRRQDPDSETVWNSVLKPVDATYTGKTIDLRSGAVTEATIERCTAEELAATVKVMGGEDWVLWIDRLQEAGLLADGVRTVAYSYMGPEISYAIYRAGTIGRAKEHLEATVPELSARLAPLGGRAMVSVNQAVVTQASAAIPAVPLYTSILLKLMKQRGTDEGPIEQIARLFADHIGPNATPTFDDRGLIRLDDLEMDAEVQSEVTSIWERIDNDNLGELSDYASYRRHFEQLFGFGVDGVDYDAPTETNRELVPAPG